MVKGKTKPEQTMTEREATVRINLTISESLDREFREVVFRRYGLRKGDIQRATEEAIRLWITKGGQ